jgi:nucleoid-associated protein YgaU
VENQSRLGLNLTGDSMKVYIFMWSVTALLLGGLFYSEVSSSENPPQQDELAKINSGFFVSRNDAYGLQDELLRERLLIFLAEKGILTKSSRGLIYYYISEDAIAQIKDLEFKERVREFVTELLEKTTIAPKSVVARPYVVQPRDTLWDIAEEHGISVEELVHLNNMNLDDPIYPGQKLIITPEGH